MVDNKTYPIGTKIIYSPKNACAAALKDSGKRGKIVGLHWCDGQPLIYLPQSEHISASSTKQIPVSWETIWKNIEIISYQKNEQLLFAFMPE